jgi:iron(II)-dependent oxidoreductase
MVHKVRPTGEERWQRALAAADVVCPASTYLAEEAAHAGLEISRWATVPNALLVDPAPVASGAREELRRAGRVRIASRVEPAKGLAELLQAIPPGWEWPVELVLAEADFEFWTGMQREVIDACTKAAATRPDIVRLLPALPWQEVPSFLAEAAATIISSTEPETFCHTAAEALSVGTPVISFDLGNVPRMAGPAGRTVPLDHGASSLWEALAELLGSREGYHAAAQAAPGRVDGFRPEHAAATLIAALGL